MRESGGEKEEVRESEQDKDNKGQTKRELREARAFLQAALSTLLLVCAWISQGRL